MINVTLKVVFDFNIRVKIGYFGKVRSAYVFNKMDRKKGF